MTITGLFVALILITMLLIMATLSTSLIFAVSQVLSRGIEVLFDINPHSHSRM